MRCMNCHLNTATCATNDAKGVLYLCVKCLDSLHNFTPNPFLSPTPGAHDAIERLRLEHAWTLPSPEHGR